jgi:hypothetical protein
MSGTGTCVTQLYDGEHLSVSRQLDFLEGAHHVHGLHNRYLLEGDSLRTTPQPPMDLIRLGGIFSNIRIGDYDCRSLTGPSIADRSGFDGALSFRHCRIPRTPRDRAGSRTDAEGGSPVLVAAGDAGRCARLFGAPRVPVRGSDPVTTSNAWLTA